MIAQSKKRKSGKCAVAVSASALSRGGVLRSGTADEAAATNTCDEGVVDFDDYRVAATDGSSCVNDLSSVGRKNNAGNGDAPQGSEESPAKPSKSKRRSIVAVNPSCPVTDDAASGGDVAIDNDLDYATTCRELQELQRRRAATIKSRIMIDNQLVALVSLEMGYHAGLEETDRKKLRAEAEKLIKAIDAGDDLGVVYKDAYHRVAGIVTNTRIARAGFDAYIKGLEKEMLRLAKSLPVAEWVLAPDQRGFGLLSLATIIGETGDLSLYSNPAKVWKRMGCAPFQGKMPSTWRFGKEGKLSAEQWSEIGYSPRRRSIAFLIGENIVKQNKTIYRKRYDDSKAAAAANHPDWTPGRCHYHGMLLATKRLLRDLWSQWHKMGASP